MTSHDRDSFPPLLRLYMMQVVDSLVSVECEEALLVIIILLYRFVSLPSVRLESDAKALARKLSPLELSLVAVDFVRVA